MKNVVELKWDLKDLERELQEVENMNEDIVCIKYNVDEKKEAIQAIKEEIAYTTRDIEENTPAEMIDYEYMYSTANYR